MPGMTPIASQQHDVATPRGRLFAQSWAPADASGAPLVLLHDSLGCVALWRDFPERLARATGRQVIAYDRLGFGRSDAHPGALPTSFIQDEARGDFSSVCQHFGLTEFVAMGHSVGGGMAVACAAQHPHACRGLITESAQAFVEDRTLDGIRVAQRQFEDAGQMDRLKKYHGDKADWVLRAWTETWLSEAFRSWSLDQPLREVRCPVLSLHGDRDEYGSVRQPERIVALVPGPATLGVLANCGHVPHRECLDEVLAAITAFLSPSFAG